MVKCEVTSLLPSITEVRLTQSALGSTIVLVLFVNVILLVAVVSTLFFSTGLVLYTGHTNRTVLPALPGPASIVSDLLVELSDMPDVPI